MPPAACSVLPSVRRASAPEMLRSTAVTTSWLCGPSSLCAEPPLGAGALGRVTWAGAGSLPGPSPSPPLPSPHSCPPGLLPLSFRLRLGSLRTAEASPSSAGISHHTRVRTQCPCVDKPKPVALVSWALPAAQGRAHSQAPAALSPPHVAFLFRAGARGATPGTLSQGCYPHRASESPVELSKDRECPGDP